MNTNLRDLDGEKRRAAIRAFNANKAAAAAQIAIQTAVAAITGHVIHGQWVPC